MSEQEISDLNVLGAKLSTISVEHGQMIFRAARELRRLAEQVAELESQKSLLPCGEPSYRAWENA